MTQQIKVIPSNPEDLSSSLRTDMVESENELPKIVL